MNNSKYISCKTILLLAGLSFFVVSVAFGLSVYEVEVSYNDELFVINGEKYEAKTYCFNINEGDQVIFIEGSPYGACATAVIKDITTDVICEVWCE